MRLIRELQRNFNKKLYKNDSKSFENKYFYDEKNRIILIDFKYL
jgi:hypothetical protein